ncbi:MAG: hypothetical protein EBY32_11015 [Proteobacteria bacterium]|nr:hypothetical protein [Pseudomonadota bacterium]
MPTRRGGHLITSSHLRAWGALGPASSQGCRKQYEDAIHRTGRIHGAGLPPGSRTRRSPGARRMV